MLNNLTRRAMPILSGIAFGFFIGCSTSSPHTSNSDGASPSREELRQRINIIDREIESNPGNAEAFYQKSSVLNQLAHLQNSPENRTEYYQQMHRSLNQAESIYQASSDQYGKEKVNELLKVSWSYEHNQGVEILQAENTLTGSDFEHAAGHFHNAIIIIPDSTVSYKMKAHTHYRNHQVDQAISTLETAYSRIEQLPSDLLEQLAFLYLENKQPAQAVDLYEKAESFSDENLNVIHGLANAYITAGRHKKAAGLLQALVDNEPQNIIYRESYASRLYILGVQKYDSVLTINPNEYIIINQMITEADTILEEAEKQFKEALKLNPQNSAIKQQLADFYHNFAAHLKQVKPLFSEEEQEEIEQRIQANLSNGITLYEELVEQNPDQTQNWKYLYQAYSYLGMQEKANEAKAKANL